jgi:hypothetical protein
MDKNRQKEAIKGHAAALLRDEGPIEAAHYLVRVLFANKTDGAGKPYLGHLERVAANIADPRIKPIGLMHDLVEDIPGWTFQDLEDVGFGDFIVEGVRAVTKADTDPYFDEMVRVGLTPQAIPVKRADLHDNSNPLRLSGIPTDKQVERTRKYYLAWHYLGDIESGKFQPGTPFATWMAAQPPEKRDMILLRKYTAAAPSGPRPRPF